MKRIILIIIAAAGLFSCNQVPKSNDDSINTEALLSTDNGENKIPSTTTNNEFVHTRYEYADSIGMKLIIENSYPRGGSLYTDPAGNDYIYAVFWTRITNETNNLVELTIAFTEHTYELPSSPGRLFKLCIPSDTLTTEKMQLFNYGIDSKQFLDNNINKLSNLSRTIRPNNTTGFYVITLFNKGVDGTLRTGLSIKDQNLFYRINDKEIQCGKINLNNLILLK